MRKQAILVVDDRSREYLQQLDRQGFEKVRIILKDRSCPECVQHEGKEYKIKDLLMHDHPLFRLTHPNCKCGLEKIEESHPEHKHYKTKTKYELEEEKFKNKLAPTKPLEKPEDVLEEEVEEEIEEPEKIGEPTKKTFKFVAPGKDRSEIDNKIDQTETEVAKTEQKIKDIKEVEEEKEASGRPVKYNPDSTKNELEKYLERIKKFLSNLKIQKLKHELDKVEKQLIEIDETDEKPSREMELAKRTLQEYHYDVKNDLANLLRGK